LESTDFLDFPFFFFFFDAIRHVLFVFPDPLTANVERFFYGLLVSPDIQSGENADPHWIFLKQLKRSQPGLTKKPPGLTKEIQPITWTGCRSSRRSGENEKRIGKKGADPRTPLLSSRKALTNKKKRETFQKRRTTAGYPLKKSEGGVLLKISVDRECRALTSRLGGGNFSFLKLFNGILD
jgi:hypothetical protein